MIAVHLAKNLLIQNESNIQTSSINCTTDNTNILITTKDTYIAMHDDACMQDVWMIIIERWSSKKNDVKQDL